MYYCPRLQGGRALVEITWQTWRCCKGLPGHRTGWIVTAGKLPRVQAAAVSAHTASAAPCKSAILHDIHSCQACMCYKVHAFQTFFQQPIHSLSLWRLPTVKLTRTKAVASIAYTTSAAPREGNCTGCKLSMTMLWLTVSSSNANNMCLLTRCPGSSWVGSHSVKFALNYLEAPGVSDVPPVLHSP